MKKFLILAIAVLGMVFGTSAQNRSINFIEGKTFEEIKELAKQENKLIFMDISASWCKPCKRMDEEIFTNDTVADFFNSHFVNVRMDATKGEGKELRKKYRAYYIPALFFISSEGQVENADYGYKKTNEFIQLGIDALDPKKQFSKLEVREKEPIENDSLLCLLALSGEVGVNNQLLPESSKAIDGICQLMVKDTTLRIRIVGYIDDSKHFYIKQYLERVSDQWVKDLCQYLISKGISERRLIKTTDIRYDNMSARKLNGKKFTENQKYMGLEIRKIGINSK